MSLDKIIAGAMVILLLIFAPVILITSKNDMAAEARIETKVTEFIDNCRSTARISPESYETFYREINGIIPSMVVDIEHSSRCAGYDGDMYIYYVDFNNDEILKVMYESDPDKNIDYLMRNGDTLKCTVWNTEATVATKFQRLFLRRDSDTTVYYQYEGVVGNYSEDK